MGKNLPSTVVEISPKNRFHRMALVMRTLFLSRNVARDDEAIHGLEWYPLDEEVLQSLSEELASKNNGNKGITGVIVDLRDQDEPEQALLKELVNLRAPMMKWVATENSKLLGSNPGIVLACRDSAHVRQLERWVTENLDCPTFWFAAGFACLAWISTDSNSPKDFLNWGLNRSGTSGEHSKA